MTAEVAIEVLQEGGDLLTGEQGRRRRRVLSERPVRGACNDLVHALRERDDDGTRDPDEFSHGRPHPERAVLP